MTDFASDRLQLSSLRPLVRYVDQTRAVLEIHMQIESLPDEFATAHDAASDDEHSERVLELIMHGPQGQLASQRLKINDLKNVNCIRFELEEPQRWWPAGMGDQPLYDLIVRLMVNDNQADAQAATLGLTSIRTIDDVAGPSLLIHGLPCDIRSVLQVRPIDENAILPVGRGSLLIVQQHFGSQRLYEAANRAGILLIQSIPELAAETDATITREVNRLASHPSLVGWLVEHTGSVAQAMTAQIQSLDPTRRVFRSLPGLN